MELDYEEDAIGTHGWVRVEPWWVFISRRANGDILIELYPDTDTDASNPIRAIDVKREEATQ